MENKGNGPTKRLALGRKLHKRNDWGEDKNYAREINRARECMLPGALGGTGGQRDGEKRVCAGCSTRGPFEGRGNAMRARRVPLNAL